MYSYFLTNIINALVTVRLLPFYDCGMKNDIPPFKREDLPTRTGDIIWRTEALQFILNSGIQVNFP